MIKYLLQVPSISSHFKAKQEYSFVFDKLNIIFIFIIELSRLQWSHSIQWMG